MTKEQKLQIMNCIKAEMNAKKLSQNEWANKKGISKSHLSNVLNPEKWELVSDKTWNELLGKVEAISNENNIPNTISVRMINKACNDAQFNKRVVAISGYTGALKTTALKNYDATNANVHYVLCRSSFGTKDLLMNIASAMGVQAKGGRALDLEEAIIEHINHTPNTLIILDSVSKIRKDAALQLIGDLCEATEGRAGFVISGTEFLYDYMMKAVQRNKRGFREFNRRIYAWTHLPIFKDAKVQVEAEQICRDNGIWVAAQIEKILKQSTCFGSLYNNIDKMKKATNS